jgi:PAS domain S-box-containing protein
MSQQRPLILIADDERDIRFILKDALESAGYEVIEAADGGQTRERVGRDHPALVLLDIRLPVVDGMLLLQEFRAAGIDMGIVVMTAHGTEQLAVNAMKEGADDYLPKPFHPDDILLVVRRVLHHRALERTSAALSREIEQEKRRLEAIFSQMNQGLLTAAPDLVVDSCNPRAQAILALPPDRIVGRRLSDIFPPIFSGAPEGVFPDTFSSGAGSESEIVLPDGTVKPVLLSFAPIAPVEGEGGGWIAVFQDMTRLKTLEREKGEFVSMIAHDLKGPLTSIFATLELVLDGTLGEVGEKQREFLNIAHSNTIKLQKMIDTFLEAYRMEAGKVPFSIAPVKPANFIAQVYERYLPVAKERAFDFSISVETDLPPLAGDAEHLSRILDNFLSNAFKFTPDGGRITLAAGRDPEAPQERLRVTVTDNGPGIPAADLPHIFEKFSQGRRRSGVGGIGLGLAYSRMAVERHGGTISVASTEGNGSTFWFTIPFSVPRAP